MNATTRRKTHVAGGAGRSGVEEAKVGVIPAHVGVEKVPHSSFPRTRESRNIGNITGLWIPAGAGMTSKLTGMTSEVKSKSSIVLALGVVPFVLLVCGGGACGYQPGSQLELRRSIAPDEATCVFASTGPTQFSGFYDPGGSNGYVLGLGLANHLEGRTEAPVTSPSGSGENIRPRTNDIILIGFDVCWFQTSSVDDIGSHGDGFVKDCMKLKTAKWVPSLGTVATGGAETGAVIEVLSHADLEELWANFRPANIGPVGVVDFTGVLSAEELRLLGTDTGVVFDQGPNPTVAAEADWGSFPNPGGSVDVLLQLRAVGQLQVGDTVHSNWINFNVTVCPHCFTHCGLLVEKICPPSVCGSGATASLCPSTGACPLGGFCTAESRAFAGSSISLADVCLPFSGYGSPECAALPGCSE